MFDPKSETLVLAVVGTGAMGRGIAQIAAAAGVTVRLLDARDGAANEAKAAIAKVFDSLVAKGRMAAEVASAAAGRLVVVTGEVELAGSDIVVEAIIEDLAAKQALFARLEPIVGEACVLATNTSSLSVTAIASGCQHPARVAGFHFFNPVPLMKVVEVIDAVATAPGIGATLAELATRMGHRPVRAVDAPGFIVNHAGRGFGTEALRLLQEGIAGFADIDNVLREAAGFRMGPFELLDLIGLDVSVPVMESVYRQFYEEPRFRPSWALRQRQVAGLLGRKTGQGFYAYDAQARQVPVEETPAPVVAPCPVWVSAEELDATEMLIELVQAAGWPHDDAGDPGPDSLCIVAPLGVDATTSALHRSLDPSRVVAIDPLLGFERRRTIMTTPVTRPEFTAAAWALFAADGTPVTRIHDSSGFVAQRVLATIINIACEIAQGRIATPDDIDSAVTLGLGYPQGPLAWGDTLGPSRVLSILERLHVQTGDPRYRPSPWLSRRARLGASLLTPEG